jgi:plasmid recombination enzyme
MCQMIFTSDQEFFDRIGEQETKRYFDECYKFICNYKNLGEENIISAVVHLDEGTPHLHLVFVPVVHTKDKEDKDIEKICARDFWKGRDSYRKLQDAYFEYVTSKGFDLERGLYVEETNRKNLSVEEFKKVTNYTKTKETLENTTLKLPEFTDIKKINKLSLNRDEKINNKIIKPQVKIIKQLHNENIALHKELSKQSKIIDVAEKYEKEKFNLETENRNLRFNFSMLQQEINDKADKIERNYENKVQELEYRYKGKIKELEKENNKLNKIIEKFKTNLKMFMKWLCNKFSYPCEDDLIRDFNKETYSNINFEQQLDINQFEQDYKDEIDFDIY